ncbi:MAG: FecR domain-containing protein [Lewinellaceae bacterium]|nr:FecR domain-containing protein [Lewinellaceae bacterium]
MNNFDEKIDSLLAKHLAGECSPEEEKVLRQWLAKSPENEQYLSDLVWLWERSASGLTPAPRAVDTEAALQKVKSKMRGTGKVVPLGRYRTFWLRAAAVLLVAIAAVYWWQTATAPEPIRIAAVETIRIDTLNDGSVVTLEQRSALTLHTKFNRRERRLHLEGEAYFEVAPDTTRPFVVEVQDLQVQVVGTAFTVDNLTDKNKVIVTVSEGKVKVSMHGQTLLLGPGDQATYDISNAQLQRTVQEQGTPVFKNRIFQFDATPLQVVVKQLSESYGVEISLNKAQLENCPLTARYNNLTLDRVLNLVAESFSFKIEKSGKGYLLVGEGCE